MALPEKRPIDAIKDTEIREQFKEIQEGAIGNVLQLSAAPTASTPLLQDNEIGEISDKLYIRVQDKIYEITPSTVTTIT